MVFLGSFVSKDTSLLDYMANNKAIINRQGPKVKNVVQYIG
jgi:hypothetical protein